jgi:division protein CdvB (Snf7/Vps24/ESCRT-III family)
MRLKVQEGKIENSLMKLQRHDKNLFNKCVTARIGKDSARAAMYASECAEIRKMAKTTLGCQLALEKSVIRLENILIHGESLNAMGPVAEVVKAIKSQIGLGQVMENLNETAMEMGEVTSQPYDEVTPTAEAQKILTEASAVADQRMNEKFPDLPTTVAGPVRARYEEPGSSQ